MEEKRTFYIRASRPKNHPFPIISWLIRLFTWSKYSHVFFTFPLKNKVFHAYFNETRYEEAEYLNEVETVHQYQIDVLKPDYERLIWILDSLVAKRKGYILQLLGIAFTLPFRLIGLKVSNPFSFLYSSITCSQMMSWSLREAGILRSKDFPKWDNDLLTEKDMVKVLDKLSKNPTDKIKVRKIK